MSIAAGMNQIAELEAPPQKFPSQSGTVQANPWPDAFVMGTFNEKASKLALKVKGMAIGHWEFAGNLLFFDFLFLLRSDIRRENLI